MKSTPITSSECIFMNMVFISQYIFILTRDGENAVAHFGCLLLTVLLSATISRQLTIYP